MQELNAKLEKGITANQLKLIAAITMAIDHVAACVLYGYLTNSPDNTYYTALLILYYIMRYIGRTAFPLFCFMIVQGFMHTSNRTKYLLRLIVCAFISEIPFDLAVNGAALDLEYQNTIFTLVLGLICIMGLDGIKERFPAKDAFRIALSVIIVAGIGALNEFVVLGDYGILGIIMIAAIYLFGSQPLIGMFAGYLALILSEVIFYGYSTEVYAIFSVFFVGLYNGKKGKALGGRYFFYIFYPAHLLLLWLIMQIVWMVIL